MPSSPGDLDGSVDVSRHASVDVMRKLERYGLTLTCGTDYDGFTHPERREWDVLAATGRTVPDAMPSSPGDLDGSVDVSRRVSVDVMRKLERYDLTLTCGTDYDGFSTCSLVWRRRRFQHGFGHYERPDRSQHVAHSFYQLYTWLMENGNALDYTRRC